MNLNREKLKWTHPQILAPLDLKSIIMNSATKNLSIVECDLQPQSGK